MNKLEAFQGKRLRFRTLDEERKEVQRIGTLSVEKDSLRLDWVEHFPRGRITYFMILDARIISGLDTAQADSEADFDCMEVLLARQPRESA